METQQPQYDTISKFDRTNAGLQGGNNLQTKASTIETVNNITGEAETFIVQTIRGEQRRLQADGTTKVTTGDFLVIKFLDKHGPMRLILPPRVSETIARQSKALTDKSRSNAAKAQAQDRKLRGVVPGFLRKAK
jgi:hypothetical protein